jgi:hypothetical protein
MRKEYELRTLKVKRRGPPPGAQHIVVPLLERVHGRKPAKSASSTRKSAR